MAKDKFTLTVKQKAFIDAYMKTFSPKQAALEAGYSKNNPSKVGYNVMQSEGVRAEIQRRMEERKKALEVVPFEAIIQRLVEITLDPASPQREQMKAADLLIKYKNTNRWGPADTNVIDEYVNALQEQVGDIWEGGEQ